MRAIVCGVICLLATNPIVAQETPAEKPTPSPWVIGNTAPPAGAIFQAWLDRGLVDPKNPNAVVTVGSPSDMTVWLRTANETCTASETAARRTTKIDEGRRLYVCARPMSSGSFRLAATAGTSTVVSDKIDATAGRAFSPTVTTVVTTLLTTFLGFLVGLLTSHIQERRQKSREEEALRSTVDTTLAKVLSAEILEHQQTLQGVVNGGDPEILKTSAYNNAEAMGSLVWRYLNSAKAKDYRGQIDAYYRTKITAYQAAARAWKAAEEKDKNARRAEATTLAEALLPAVKSRSAS